jgi:hypothetical protein
VLTEISENRSETIFNMPATGRICLPFIIALVVVFIVSNVSAFRFPANAGKLAAVPNTQWLRVTRGMPALRSIPEPVLSDETLEEWLDDMIYSGDIEGYIRRKAKDVINEDFEEYLQERLEACEDEDEKKVISDIANMITSKLRAANEASDGAEQYEARLDKILFTAPNARKAFIENNLDGMTPGFIEYIQKEMKSNADADSKVVYASILQLIGQTKGDDLLGNDAAILSQADASLGDQFKVESKLLEDGLSTTKVGDRNERILAALMFSQNDILEDVLNNVSMQIQTPTWTMSHSAPNFSFDILFYTYHSACRTVLYCSCTRSTRTSCPTSRTRSTPARTWTSAWASALCSRPSPQCWSE